MSELKIGSGTVVASSPVDIQGLLAVILSNDDLIRLLDEDSGEPILAVVSQPNVTMIAPLQDRLVGVICSTGSELAHVAIVSRELGIPCIINADLGTDLRRLDGHRARLATDGSIWTITGDPASCPRSKA